MTIDYNIYKINFCQSLTVLDLESNESLKYQMQAGTENRSQCQRIVQQDTIRENKSTSQQDKPTGTLGGGPRSQSS